MADAPVRRQTKQRAAVAEALESQGEFRSAQEIYDIVRKRGDSIGLTTVYRSLQSMADDGQVDVIVRGDGESVYRQCSPSHHHHLVCRSM
jgi:Fur family ferric uptake transcriptional regulator